MSEFSDHLAELAADEDLDRADRLLVNQALDQWNAGIIPHSKIIQRISRMTKARSPTPCSRMRVDGGCGWLRKHGAHHNLPVPPQGEPAMCFFGELMPRCPGYCTRSR